jgi:predicted acetyltransferase
VFLHLQNSKKRTSEKLLAHIELIPAPSDQEPILANLLELYAHDFSEFHNVELGADGRFGYKHLSLYWSEPHRHPFLIKVDGRLAGLVLVKRKSDDSNSEAVWDVAEFFIVRAYRRQGIGMKVAHEVWKRFPGSWEVRVMDSNHGALDFWQRAVATFNGEAVHPARIEKDQEPWYVFAFESKQAP